MIRFFETMASRVMPARGWPSSRSAKRRSAPVPRGLCFEALEDRALLTISGVFVHQPPLGGAEAYLNQVAPTTDGKVGEVPTLYVTGDFASSVPATSHSVRINGVFWVLEGNYPHTPPDPNNYHYGSDALDIRPHDPDQDPLRYGPNTVEVTTFPPGQPSIIESSTFSLYPTPESFGPSSEKSTVPSKAVAGQPFMVKVDGTSFVPSTQLAVQGPSGFQIVEAQFISSTEIDLQMTATQAGIYSVSFVSGPQGGPDRNPVDFLVVKSDPTITSVATTSESGDSALTYRINGTGFVRGAGAYWNGDPRPTQFISSTELKVVLLPADLAAPGSIEVQIPPPVADTGISNGFPITFNLPTASVSGMNPQTVQAGGPQFTLALYGSGFVPTSKVSFNGTAIPPTSIIESDGELDVTVPANLIQNVGTASIVVSNGTHYSDPVSLAIVSAVNPLTTTPTSLVVGTSQIIAIHGSGFTFPIVSGHQQGPQAYWNGQSLNTIFVGTGTGFDTTQIQATIPASLTATAGIAQITVVNPQPTGPSQVLGPVAFAVNNPKPFITPGIFLSATAGADTTLTITGSNFVAGATATFRGIQYPTNLVSSQQLTVTIPGSQIPDPLSEADTTATLTIDNPHPEVTSSGVNVSIQVSTPTISSLSPESLDVENNGFTATPSGTTYNPVSGTTDVVIDGSNFVPGETTVLLVGPGPSQTITPAEFTRDEMTVAIPNDDLKFATTYQIVISNFVTGVANQQATVNLSVDNFTPQLVNLDVPVLPRLSDADAADLVDSFFQITLFGSDFAPNSTVSWSGPGTSPISGIVSVTNDTLVLTLDRGLAAAGVHHLSVVNPGPGGGTSSSLDLLVTDPLARVTSYSHGPLGIFGGGPNSVLTVNGQNFQTGAQVIWNGVLLSTTFVSSTQLTATLTPALLAGPGTFSVDVMDGDGQISAAASYHLLTTQPVLTALSPNNIPPGSRNFTLTVAGNYFLPDAQVEWNGNPLSTTYISGSQLQATVPASDVAQLGPATVSVVDSAGANPNSQTFTVRFPLPVVSDLAPPSAAAGSIQSPAVFTLTLHGTNFRDGISNVEINNAADAASFTSEPTIFDSSTQLRVLVPASFLATARTALVHVRQSDGGGLSNNLSWLITDATNIPTPTLQGLSRTTFPAGGPTFPLTLTASNLVAGALVKWNATTLTPATITTDAITLNVPFGLVATQGTASIQIENPAPGGNKLSAPVSFTIAPPAPWENALSPEDVDNNGLIDAQDVLIIINELLANGSHTLPSTGAPTSYFDSNGDGLVTPEDVLVVINYLFAQQDAAENAAQPAALQAVMSGLALSTASSAAARDSSAAAPI